MQKKLLLLFLVLAIFMVAFVLISCDSNVNKSDEQFVPEVVEKKQGYISIKVPPIKNASRTISSSEARSLVDDYYLFVSSRYGANLFQYSTREDQFNKVAVGVGTYDVILFATYNKQVVGLAMNKDVVIKEYQITSVPMTLQPFSMSYSISGDLYTNSTITVNIDVDESIRAFKDKLKLKVGYEILNENGEPVTERNYQSIWSISSRDPDCYSFSMLLPDNEGTYSIRLGYTIYAVYSNPSVFNVLTASASNDYYNSYLPSAYYVHDNDIAANSNYIIDNLVVTVPPTGIDIEVGWNDDEYEVSFGADANGVVNVTSLNVLRDTEVISNGNIVSVGDSIVEATPNEGYSFKEWNGIPENGCITEPTVITAIFTKVE